MSYYKIHGNSQIISFKAVTRSLIDALWFGLKKTSLTLPNCNWNTCTYKRSQRAGICVLVESLLPLSTILIFIFDFGLVPTVSFDFPFVRLFGVR